MAIKNYDITLVSEDLPKGCGLETYHKNLIGHLKKKGVNVKFSGIKKLFGNYPFSLLSPARTKIMHFTDQKVASVLFFSPFRRYKAIVTVHDITELINFKNIYEISTPWAKMVHKIWSWIIKKSLKRADAIIAVSEHTKKDLQKLIGRNKGIYVTYEAADKKFKPFNIDKQPYSVLYVGSALAHKNLKTLLNAFCLVMKKIPQARLVLVGKSLPYNKGLRDLIKKLDLEDSIIFKGYVKDTPREYSKAGVFVFPSLYEGFGLPVIEAMACGCPVICSDKTSLPEVAGDAAIYFDGHDSKDLAGKIYNVLTDRKLKNSLVKKGLAQTKRFIWEKTAQKTMQIYEKVFEG